jgi:hypothetical protein
LLVGSSGFLNHGKWGALPCSLRSLSLSCTSTPQLPRKLWLRVDVKIPAFCEAPFLHSKQYMTSPKHRFSNPLKFLRKYFIPNRPLDVHPIREHSIFELPLAEHVLKSLFYTVSFWYCFLLWFCVILSYLWCMFDRTFLYFKNAGDTHF